jgi:hypothetical protein
MSAGHGLPECSGNECMADMQLSVNLEKLTLWRVIESTNIESSFFFPLPLLLKNPGKLRIFIPKTPWNKAGRFRAEAR